MFVFFSKKRLYVQNFLTKFLLRLMCHAISVSWFFYNFHIYLNQMVDMIVSKNLVRKKLVHVAVLSFFIFILSLALNSQLSLSLSSHNDWCRLSPVWAIFSQAKSARNRRVFGLGQLEGWHYIVKSQRRKHMAHLDIVSYFHCSRFLAVQKHLSLVAVELIAFLTIIGICQPPGQGTLPGW